MTALKGFDGVPTILILRAWSPDERWEQAHSAIRFVHPMANAS